MAIKAVIFDMDDTLLRTYRIAYGTYMLTAKALGLKKVPMKRFLKHWGFPYNELIKGTWRNAPIEKFSKMHGKLAKKRPYSLIKGTNEMLAELKRKKLFLAIMSSKHTKAIPLRAKQAGLKLNYFRELIGLESAPFHKPDARVFRKLIAELKGRKIKKSEILYIGDGLMDYKAAKNAGLQFAAVLTGFRKRKDFQRAGLKKENILKSAVEVPAFIESQEIKAIVFDYNGVCAKEWHAPIVEKYAGILGVSKKKVWRAFHKSHNDEYYLGKVKNPTAHRVNKIIRMVNPTGKKCAKKLIEIYLKSHPINKKIMEMVRALKKHYKIAMLSNIYEDVKKYSHRKGHFIMFDPAIFSYDAHLMKPDARIYRLLLRRLKLKPEQCIFIDDSERNTKAAEKLGFKTILYESPEQLKEDLHRFDIEV